MNINEELYNFIERGKYNVDGISTNVDMNNFSEEIFINIRKVNATKKQAKDKKELYEISIQGKEVKNYKRN